MSFNDEITDPECSICLQRFHDPIILDCGHTFDRSYIKQMLDGQNKLSGSRGNSRCPICTSTFDSGRPFTSNKSLAHVLKCETTYEWFLVDVSYSKQSTHALTFLKRLFDKRDILETNHITIQTGDTRMIIDPKRKFEQELQVGSMTNLGNTLRDITTSSEDLDGLRKICILTDGSTKHSNLTKVDASIIHQRLIIHIGDRNRNHTRELADKINFQFGYFHEKTLEDYVEHFLRNF